MIKVLPASIEEGIVARKLIVLVHAYALGPRSLRSVKLRTRESFGNADILIPSLPIGRFQRGNLNQIAARLAVTVHERCAARQTKSDGLGYNEIVLIGHSLGALLARKSYIIACGKTDGMELENEVLNVGPFPWAAIVERIVLLAAMNRGWRISNHLTLPNLALWSVGTFVASFVERIWRGDSFVILQIRQGAPFITQLRMQWLALRRRERNQKRETANSTAIEGGPLTIQLLGSVDDMVSPTDNIDLISGRDFIYIDVPKTGHVNIIQMDGEENAASRAEVFRYALETKREVLASRTLHPSDEPPAGPDRTVTDVVFVIHGIRDQGYWTQKIARQIINVGMRSSRVFRSKTASYGYFPMLPFLLPSRRREKVEWLMDEYVEAYAKYPSAKFFYVGHSNGTYLVTRALELYGCCKFERIVFAGSVVRCNYPWNSARVGEVLNYVASGDWVVAIFPRALQMLKLQDLGSAGHDGFSGTGAQASVQVRNFSFARGGHGAALEEDHWKSIAEYVVHGTPPDSPPPTPTATETQIPAAWVRLCGKIAPLIWLLIAGILVLGGHFIWTHSAPRAAPLALAAYIFVIWKIVTRV